jgi:hypothetical protein
VDLDAPLAVGAKDELRLGFRYPGERLLVVHARVADKANRVR